jgi:hypothetical protein
MHWGRPSLPILGPGEQLGELRPSTMVPREVDRGNHAKPGFVPVSGLDALQRRRAPARTVGISLHLKQNACPEARRLGRARSIPTASRLTTDHSSSSGASPNRPRGTTSRRPRRSSAAGGDSKRSNQSSSPSARVLAAVRESSTGGRLRRDAAWRPPAQARCGGRGRSRSSRSEARVAATPARRPGVRLVVRGVHHPRHGTPAGLRLISRMNRPRPRRVPARPQITDKSLENRVRAVIGR